MLDVMHSPPGTKPTRLLDFGCGASHFYEHLLQHGYENIEYSGLDISRQFIDLSAEKFPGNRYWCLDVLADESLDLPRFDYAVMNGVFTVKRELPFEEMLDFMQRVVSRVFELVDIGIAFNVMSKHVDWERDDLFHLPFDLLAAWLTADVSRNFVLRNDYGLYEYTAYVYR